MALRPVRGPGRPRAAGRVRPGRAHRTAGRSGRLSTVGAAGATGDDPAVAAALQSAFEGEWSRIVATLIRVTGDWDVAEEAAAGALERALVTWPQTGIPRNPGAWLTTAARNLALDRLRRRGVEATKLKEWAAMEGAGTAGPPDPADVATAPEWDDRLRLIFACAHPALPLEARVALTLRAVGGLTTAEVAHAFLVSEPTMAQRIVRAKAKIANAGIPYRVPDPAALPERLDGVLAVLYLVYNEGYTASSGDSLQRLDLAAEAIRLTRLLVDLLPDGETTGLLALMLLQHARSAARIDASGDLIPLEEQDRSRWNGDELAEGLRLLAGHADDVPGPYRVQAEIQAVHARARTASETDWRTILGWYEALPATPVVELNRAVAVGMAAGPEAGLRLLAALEATGGLVGHHLLPAAQADLSRRCGRMHDAKLFYRRALKLAPTEPERRYLERRLASLS